jgi:hypothetical protein
MVSCCSEAAISMATVKLPTINSLWPVDVFVGRGTSKYGKLLLGFLHEKKFVKQLCIHEMEIATDYPINCFNLLVLRVKTNNNYTGIVHHCMLFSRTSGSFVWRDFSITISEQHENGHEMWPKHVAVLQ